LNKLICNKGFTLIELLVVIAILAVMALIALPRISGFINSQRQESSLFHAYITAVADNAFISGKTNYLCIQLNLPGDGNKDPAPDMFKERNSLSVYNLSGSTFEINPGKVLSQRKFSSSFIFEAVILEGGKTIEYGNVLIPFYSDGSSEYFVLKVNSEGNNLFFRKDKNAKSTDRIEEIQVLK
jgi:prepilin-type N-terminal cleavage/methylation domain-containing protein